MKYGGATATEIKRYSSIKMLFFIIVTAFERVFLRGGGGLGFAPNEIVLWRVNFFFAQAELNI